MSREIIFTDINHRELFRIPDDSCIDLISYDGKKSVILCKYMNEHETNIGGCIYDTGSFVQEQAEKGSVFAPCDRRPEEIGMYEIYQIRNIRDTDYAFRSFDEAKAAFNPLDYTRVYAAMLSPGQSLDGLFARHNADDRPFGQKMRSLSVSDVVVLLKDNTVAVYYVDSFGFTPVQSFFEPKTLPVSQRDTVSGYTVTARIPIGEKMLVLAENPHAVQPFVTWQGHKDSKRFDWGHYYDRRVDAVRDLYRRVNSERDNLPFVPEKPKQRNYER
jgi:hypothetical protein